MRFSVVCQTSLVRGGGEECAINGKTSFIFFFWEGRWGGWDCGLGYKFRGIERKFDRVWVWVLGWGWCYRRLTRSVVQGLDAGEVFEM